MNYIQNFFYTIALKERSAQKLALSFCLGNYIAFSPFLGLHTAMCIAMAWLFRLNIAVTLTSSVLINNLWTAIPIYVTDYIFGYWLLHKVLQWGNYLYTPHWLEWVQNYSAHFLGLPSLCFWSFMVGGNLLGIATSVVIYPGILHLCRAILKEDSPFKKGV